MRMNNGSVDPHGSGIIGNFHDQLFAHSLGECIRAIRRNDKGTISADNQFLKGIFQIIIVRSAGAVAAEHCQAIDGNVCVDHLLAGNINGRAAPVVGTVSGDVDDPPETPDIIFVD